MHSFNPKIAEMVGIAPAVIYQNIVWWIAKNEANEQNKYDGYYWTYNSVKAFSTLFPYLTEKQIRTSLDKLVEVGAIVVGNYNKSAYDRTKWFRLGGQIDLPCGANGNASEGQPIPDVKPPIKPVLKKEDTNVSSKEIRGSRLKADWQPTDQDRNSVLEMGFNWEEIDHETNKFRDYWISKAGAGGVKRDWSATWRNWCRNVIERRGGKAGKPNPVRDDGKPQTFLGETLRLIKEREGYGYGG
jgi:hypothetical protein